MPLLYLGFCIQKALSYLLPVLFLEVGVTIFAQLAGTRPGPSLMGRVLPSPIRNKVGYGFKKKNPKWVRVLLKKSETRPETRPG